MTEIIKATMNYIQVSDGSTIDMVTENVKLTEVNEKLMTLEMISEDGRNKVMITFEKR